MGKDPSAPENDPDVSHYKSLYDEIRALRAKLEEEMRARTLAEESLRETHAAMIKHQQVGKMGNFRFNTVTGESRGSAESFRMLGIDPNTSMINFEIWANTVHPDDRKRILDALFEAIQAREPLKFEYRIIADGEIKQIRCDGQPDDDHEGDLVYYGTLTDVTERKMAEEALRRAEGELAASLRLASMGELAGSIIHEINQPLAAIGVSADACRRWIAAGPERAERALASLDRVIAESRRAAAVVAGLRTLTRDADPRIDALDLPATVREIASLVMAELAREHVLLEMDIPAELPPVRGDRTQVQQVMMNLIRNAIEAMRSVDRRRVLTLSAAQSDETVTLRVADTGPGVEASKIESLFQPLYTTKTDGMGLGLAISRKIAAAHGGRLWAEAGDGPGAVFCVSLPVAQA